MADRKLSVEERILWGKIAKSTRALPGRLADLLEFEAAFEENPVEPQPAKAVSKPVAFDASYSPTPAIKKPSGLSNGNCRAVICSWRRGSICTV